MKELESRLEVYYNDVFRFLLGLSRDEHLAEDLTQETFFKAYRSLKSYRGDSDFRVWLCSIAKNLYYSHCRKQKQTTEIEDLDALEARLPSFTEMISDRDMSIRIHKVLHHIPDPYKEVFSLRIFGELSFKEIADVFEKNDHWACVTFHRAKSMIMEKMKEELK